MIRYLITQPLQATFTHDEQVLLVREFGLWSTTFRRVDGQEIIAPNAVLAKYGLYFLDTLGSLFRTFQHQAHPQPQTEQLHASVPHFRDRLLMLIVIAGGKVQY